MNNDNETKTRTYIIIGFIVLSLVIVGIVVLFYKFNNNASTTVVEPVTHEYTDPGSGETIDTPDGKTPEKYGVNPNIPIYLGFSNLIDRGVTDDQVRNLKSALNDFTDQTKDTLKITQISLTVNSITHTINPDTGDGSYTFLLTTNRGQAEYMATITTPTISGISLSLATKAAPGTPIFTESRDD